MVDPNQSQAHRCQCKFCNKIFDTRCDGLSQANAMIAAGAIPITSSPIVASLPQVVRNLLFHKLNVAYILLYIFTDPSTTIE